MLIGLQNGKPNVPRPPGHSAKRWCESWTSKSQENEHTNSIHDMVPQEEEEEEILQVILGEKRETERRRR
jgi:hypothetical protein